MSEEAQPITRMRYLNDADGNIIPLDKDDYETEQQYHIRMRSELNKALYKSGVLGNGLRVNNKVTDGVTLWDTLEISAGIAVDESGREIIATVPIEREIQGFGTEYFVRIKYGQITPQNQEDRWKERPEVFLDPAPLDKNIDGIVLARITLKIEDGKIANVDIDETAREVANIIQPLNPSVIGVVDLYPVLSAGSARRPDSYDAPTAPLNPTEHLIDVDIPDRAKIIGSWYAPMDNIQELLKFHRIDVIPIPDNPKKIKLIISAYENSVSLLRIKITVLYFKF